MISSSFMSLRSSEIILFWNLQLFYWHFLEILWIFITFTFWSLQFWDGIILCWDLLNGHKLSFTLHFSLQSHILTVTLYIIIFIFGICKILEVTVRNWCDKIWCQSNLIPFTLCSREVSILWSYLDITLLFSSYVYLIFFEGIVFHLLCSGATVAKEQREDTMGRRVQP